MVFDLSKKDTSTFFVNLSKIGTGSVNDFADVTQNYNQVIIENASEYLISLERATIPLHTIKFFNDITNALSFVKKSDNSIISHNLQDIYSFQDFIQALNNMADSAGNKIVVYLKTSGRLLLKYDHYDTFNIVLSNELKHIFDFDINTLSFTQASVSLLGASSCINRTDSLKRIIIVSRDIPAISEFNNKIKLKELTSIDYSPSVSFTSGGGNNKPIGDDYSISLYPRDNLVLEPHYSRLLYMSGSQITSVNIVAYAEILNFSTLKTELTQISLRPLAEFNIKLQFWRRGLQ